MPHERTMRWRSRSRALVRPLLTSMVFAVISSAQAQRSQAMQSYLMGYQRPDGAITVLLHGDVIDPYFAAKALIGAADAHADVRSAAVQWIEWLMPRQNADGSFDRFCIRNGKTEACAKADADDSAMALWIELLVRYAPQPKLPRQWQSSMDKAIAHLDRLYDKQRGVYLVSPTLRVGLLMDNVEVYEAMQQLSRYYGRIGDVSAAAYWRTHAHALSESIKRVFFSSGKYRPSTQRLTDQSFYPAAVAQIFPILSDIGVPGQPSAEFYAAWMKQYCQAWLEMPSHDYPWGLVALASQKYGDRAAVTCWHAHAAPFRHGAHWNVLEEALFISFEGQLADPLAPARCCMPPSS